MINNEILYIKVSLINYLNKNFKIRTYDGGHIVINVIKQLGGYVRVIVTVDERRTHGISLLHSEQDIDLVRVRELIRTGYWVEI